MTQQTISVADALNRLKVIKARIAAGIAAPVIAVRSANRIPQFNSLAHFETSARAAMQSTTALLRNYTTLKSALVESNAQTRVMIGGVEMTVAAAIERKTSIAQEQALLSNLTTQLMSAKRTADSQNAQVLQQAEKQAISYFDGKPDKQAKEYADFISSYVARNQSDILDPLGLEGIVALMSKGIEDFLANVDLALTTSNVRTEITVDLSA